MNYSERALAILKKAGARRGHPLVQGKDGEQKGVLMPHHQFSDPDVIVIKLKSGYNVGIRLNEGVSILVQDRAEERARPARHAKTDASLPTVAIIGTGGTIASYVDYRTGAVHPALSADDMVAAVPEISYICNVRRARVLYSISARTWTPSLDRDRQGDRREIRSRGRTGHHTARHGHDGIHHRPRSASCWRAWTRRWYS